ncbi:MAG: glycosyl hydrolase family 43 [Spirochaetaceae bacterium]|nr:glycosyl hydrolase family 43 [Spirochaetaceae bacterium]|tara:strand:+ start:26790 stop:27881 length:1092 start_codon:yes stop_codon:yes gene_type:complete
MKLKDFLSLNWSDPGTALIEPPSASPVVADPSVLLPQESPNGLYQLFAHTIWGLHRFESEDGATWNHRGLVVRFGMRPFIRGFDGLYYLYYERYPPFLMPLSWLPLPWRSRIEVRTSRDLLRWSSPRTCIKPHLPWHKAFKKSASVSNPCVVPFQSGYRMYYSASLVFVPDCGFSEPAYIGIAESDRPEGPWKCMEKPVLSPDPELPGRNMGCGSIKVYEMEDGWIGLQNGIYLESDARSAAGSHNQNSDWKTGEGTVTATSSIPAPERSSEHEGDGTGTQSRSRSALFLLTSKDGLTWNYGKREPLISPTEGWMKSHVYACDCRKLDDGQWALYFNARDEWNVFKGKERIGRIVGKSDENSQ